MQRIVIDSGIPFIKGVLEPYFDVEYCAGKEINKNVLGDAVALVTRTRTLCNEALLGGTQVRAIFTATIGLDHIDLDYCKSAGISVNSAQGCNSRAVAQWVFSAIQELQRCRKVDESYTLGIIGVGTVGSEVESIANEKCIKVLRCDPPRAQRGEGDFSSLDDVLRNSDIVTLHLPLDMTTRGLVDSDFLSKMPCGAVLLNSSRGEVVNQGDVLCDSSHLFAFDVWCNEPMISLELLAKTELATPHIAGYSARGKARGTTITVQSIAREFGIEELLGWDCASEYPLENPFGFDIKECDRTLRQTPELFEQLRTVR